MENEEKTKIKGEDGLWIELPEYEAQLVWREHDGCLVAAFYKKEKDRNDNHKKLSEEEIERLVEDLKDLSDWRHYRRLKNKLNAKEQ